MRLVLHADEHVHPCPATRASARSPFTADSSAASDCGTRTCTSRNRWFTARSGHRHRRALVLAHDRREPRHRHHHRRSPAPAALARRWRCAGAFSRRRPRLRRWRPRVLRRVRVLVRSPSSRRASRCRPSSICSAYSFAYTLVRPSPAVRRGDPISRTSPALEHHDHVRPPHGGQPVRDHERRAVAHQRRQRVLHQQLRLGVERGRRLVQDQQRRVLEQGPRDRQALPLPAREPLPALADPRLVLLRHARRRTRARARPVRPPRSSAASPRAGRRRCWRRSCRRTARSPASPCRSALRSDLSVTSRMSTPSTRMAPPVTS